MTKKTVNVRTYSQNLGPAFFEQAREVSELFKRPVIESADVEGWAVASLNEEDAEIALESVMAFVADTLPDDTRRDALQSALLAAHWLFQDSRFGIRQAKDEALRLAGTVADLETEAENERAAEVLGVEVTR